MLEFVEAPQNAATREPFFKDNSPLNIIAEVYLRLSQYFISLPRAVPLEYPPPPHTGVKVELQPEPK